MDDKNKTAIQMIGWYIIALLIPILAVIIEWVQTIEMPVSLAALLIAAVSATGVLINRLIKLYFELSGENPLEPTET